MPILIAVNPYKHLSIYDDNHISKYKKFFLKLQNNPNSTETPNPHLYHIGEAAYQDMLCEKKNQSIIISGESGSGKTQSTKIILKYLAVSSLYTDNNNINKNSNKNVKEDEENITVEKQVLDSNPLMEAFGNAKTVKNNNSSRFGKFIQVNFSQNGKILSAKIFNYLLEKSRVVSIQPEERNYHIFYQLIRGADSKERQKYQIRELEHFNYLKNGCFDVDETDDKANFIEMKECMTKLKFKPEEMSYIFTVLMGILYIGNITFLEDTNNPLGGSLIDPLVKSDFSIASELLGIDHATLTSIMTKRKLKDPMSDKYYERILTVEKAYNTRDAIAKTIYSKVFDFLIRRVNQAISNTEEMKKAKNVLKIGLLDIFGFENFEVNSFEQLCINYANERLQQYFNNHIFKLEQEEYKKEEIDFTEVEFKDNNEIIDLIDNSKRSIFSLLDSEAIVPNGNDAGFERNVYKYFSDHPNLNTEEKENEFLCISHYAGDVYYHTYGFMEKNIDQVTQDVLDALAGSKSKLLKKIFEKKDETVDPKKKGKSSGAPASTSGKLQSESLSKQFKKQLDELMKMLSQSNPRYVKCIKPNPYKRHSEIESLDVSEQLLSAGVLEAIKIRKQGYSIRRTHEEFVTRYLKLYPDVGNNLNIYKEKGFKPAVLEMFNFFSKIPEMKEIMKNEKRFIQFGINKVFMKEEVKDVLEYKLNRIKFIQRIQNNFRRWKVQRKVLKMLKSIKKIQSHYKGLKYRRL
jgi:myosin-5